jgi:hypothetical protein
VVMAEHEAAKAMLAAIPAAGAPRSPTLPTSGQTD